MCCKLCSKYTCTTIVSWSRSSSYTHGSSSSAMALADALPLAATCMAANVPVDQPAVKRNRPNGDEAMPEDTAQEGNAKDDSLNISSDSDLQALPVGRVAWRGGVRGGLGNVKPRVRRARSISTGLRMATTTIPSPPLATPQHFIFRAFRMTVMISRREYCDLTFNVRTTNSSSTTSRWHWTT